MINLLRDKVKSSDKVEGDRRDKFYNLFNTFCYKSKHYAEIQPWNGDTVGYLHCVQIAASKNDKIFELPVFKKT